MAETAEATPPMGEGILSQIFSSCATDPRGSVHRVWGISLLFVVLYFVVAIFESMYFRLDKTTKHVLCAIPLTNLLFVPSDEHEIK